jgi:hypothetical protein
MKKTTLAGLIGCFMTLVGCGQAESESNVFGVVTKNFVWPDRRIEVCWSTPGYPREKADIKKYIEEEINARTSVTFFGWNDCIGDSGHKLKVAINPQSHPHMTVGKGGSAYGEMFSYDFDRDGFRGCVNTPALCMHNVSIHEFGHGLGLYHEQDRTDSSCTNTQKIGSDKQPVGPYDPLSIMNYCNPYTYKKFIGLTAGDIQAVNYLYQLPFAVDVKEIPPAMEVVAGRATTFPYSLLGDESDALPASVELIMDNGQLATTLPDVAKKAIVTTFPEGDYVNMQFKSTDGRGRQVLSNTTPIKVVSESEVAFDFSKLARGLDGKQRCQIVKDVGGTKEDVHTAFVDSEEQCRKYCDVILPLAFSDRHQVTCEY